MRLHVLLLGSVILSLVLSGCSVLEHKSFSADYGKSRVPDRHIEALSKTDIDYWTDVKPILETRCVACHACYDAPCQLKLGSIEGIERGANSELIYNQTRITPLSNLTRLFEDAHSTQTWRTKDFYPVLNERDQTPEANKQASVMYQMLLLKEAHPLPEQDVLPESYVLSLYKENQCTKDYKFDVYAKDFPEWGMPYALPGLKTEEQRILKTWIEQGATYTARPALASTYVNQIKKWETFLNQDSLKVQLMSRYIYEHLYIGHLYFNEVDDKQFFKLVRSATPPGEPIEIISTRRPYDSPDVSRVYYRLTPYLETVVTKTHMPYALNAQRLKRWTDLFIDTPATVTELPSYDPKLSANPFKTYTAIPYQSRYKFMLDEAEFTLMGFMKGPVCRGQVALNVIQDHFWIYFVDPDVDDDNGDYLIEASDLLSLPSADGNIYSVISHWRKYAKQQEALNKSRDERITLNFKDKISLDAIWNGQVSNSPHLNPNAALTIFRHNDSATIEKGMLGQKPKTAWVISYQLMERLHYLLVAGYDIYGNAGHQLFTRIYMDFLRMEGENNFLFLLPSQTRIAERDFWYKDASEDTLEHIKLQHADKLVEPKITYHTDNPKHELFDMLSAHLKNTLPTPPYAAARLLPEIIHAKHTLEAMVGDPAIDYFPQSSIVQIIDHDKRYYFTLIKNTEHKNVMTLFDEASNLAPEEDYLTLEAGFLTAYPNQYFSIKLNEFHDFVTRVQHFKDEKSYQTLLSKYGIRRTSKDFWAQSDLIHNDFKQLNTTKFGILDYNRLDNR